MKKLTLSLLAVTATALMIQDIAAQRPDGSGRPRGEGRGGGRGGPGGGPGGDFRERIVRMNPMFMAIDANQDGQLDEAEIKNAAAALKKLDKNNDGKLTTEELMPDFGGFGGRGGGRGGPGGGGRGGPGGGGGQDFAARIMGYDENNDGKISEDELPERMQRMMENLDTDGDGYIEKEELEAVGRGGRGGRGGQGGERPSRPQRPQ